MYGYKQYDNNSINNLQLCLLFLLLSWHVLSPHLILPVKTRIILKSLSEVCKQTTFRNVKRDNGCRENMAVIVLTTTWNDQIWGHVEGREHLTMNS